MGSQKFNANKLKEKNTNTKLAISAKENQVETASIFLKQEIVDNLRDELEGLNKEAQFGMEMPAEEQAEEENPIAQTPEDLKRTIEDAVANSYSSIMDDYGTLAFDVLSNEDVLKIIPTSEVNKDKFEQFNVDEYYNSVLSIIDEIIIGVDEESKTYLKDSIKEMLEQHYASFSEKSGIDEDGVLSIFFDEDSDQIVEGIFALLRDHNLSGLDAYENYEEISHQTDGIETGVGIMSNKKPFNLRKTADKVYDSVRERSIQEVDLQYRTRHPKSLPWYEDAYIRDYHWRNSVMDKYSPEKMDSEGNYRGGYINNRFKVHHNDEGNSMHVKPGQRLAPDRPESYSTERRLEIMRNEDKRGYEPSEGSETEQQNHMVFAGKMKVSQENGLYKVRMGSKVVYFDTDEDLARLAEMAESGLAIVEEPKKKVTEALLDATAPQPQLLTQSPAEQATSENPLDQYLANLNLAPNDPRAEKAIQSAVMRLHTEGRADYSHDQMVQWVNPYRAKFGLPLLAEHDVVEDAGPIDHNMME